MIKRANEEQSQFESIEAKLIVKDVEQRTSKLGNVDEYEEPKEENETNNNKPKDYSEKYLSIRIIYTHKTKINLIWLFIRVKES